MTISDHEQKEFRRLTADLMLDNSALKKAAKTERAMTMSYMALPSRSMIKKFAVALLGTIGLILAIVAIQTSNVVLVIQGSACAVLAVAALVFMTLQEKEVLKRNTETDSH